MGVVRGKVWLVEVGKFLCEFLQGCSMHGVNLNWQGGIQFDR